MKPTLFVDIDGTLADSASWWLHLYNRKYGTTWTKNHIVEYDWTRILEHDISEFYGNYLGVKPIPGALESVWRLADKFRIVFATSGYGKEWIRSYYPPFQEKNFIQVADKSLLNGWGLVDDNPLHLDVFQGAKFLHSQPWNAGRGLNDETWYTICKFLEEV